MIKSIGELNKQIEVLRIKNEKDAEGFYIPEESSIVKCWAAVRDGTYKANEHFAAALGRSSEITEFIVRDVIVRKHKIGAGLYIRFEGELYRIIARPYNAVHARDYVKISAEAVSEVSG